MGRLGRGPGTPVGTGTGRGGEWGKGPSLRARLQVTHFCKIEAQFVSLLIAATRGKIAALPLREIPSRPHTGAAKVLADS